MKKIYFGKELREMISRSSKEIRRSVEVTLGPLGRNVILGQKDRMPMTTKDGVTVATFFDHPDPFISSFAKIIKQASLRTNREAGDGTTSTIIMADALLQNALTLREEGVESIFIKRGIDEVIDVAVDYIQNELSKPISSLNDIRNIALISSNGDEEVADLIANAVDGSGKNGAISIAESGSEDMRLDFFEGFKMPKGLKSPKFANNKEKKILQYRNALVFITDHEISDINDIMEILSLVAQDGRPLFIVCSKLAGSALEALILNVDRGSLNVAVAESPFYGDRRKEFLEDMAVMLGATMYSTVDYPRTNFAEFKLEMLGSCGYIFSSEFETAFTQCDTNMVELEERIKQFKDRIEVTYDENIGRYLQERISRMSSSIATILVGGNTEVEAKERMHRVEDALNAVKSAQIAGILPGGGLAYLLTAINKIFTHFSRTGKQEIVSCVYDAMFSIFDALRNNACLSEEQLDYKEVIESGGFNFFTLEKCDALQSGIIDPTLVVTNVLKNAASVATALLMCEEAIIDDEPERK